MDCEINKIPREEIINISRKDENVEDKLEMKHKDPEGKDSSSELYGVVFINKMNLKRHLQCQHVPGKIDRRRKGNIRKQKCVCDDCGKEFSTMSNLELHKRRFHSEEKPYRCDECEQTFKEKVQMESHMVELHGKPNPCLCPECGKRFIKNRSHQQHL